MDESRLQFLESLHRATNAFDAGVTTVSDEQRAFAALRGVGLLDSRTAFSVRISLTTAVFVGCRSAIGKYTTAYVMYRIEEAYVAYSRSAVQHAA